MIMIIFHIKVTNKSIDLFNLYIYPYVSIYQLFVLKHVHLFTPSLELNSETVYNSDEDVIDTNSTSIQEPDLNQGK